MIVVLALTFIGGICGTIIVSAQTKAIKINGSALQTKKKPAVKTGVAKNPPSQTNPATLAGASSSPDKTSALGTVETAMAKAAATPKLTVKKITTTKTPAKTPAKTVATKAKTTTSGVKWASSGLSAVSRIPSGVRPAYKKKVESYAKRNNIKIITAAVVSGMHE